MSPFRWSDGSVVVSLDGEERRLLTQLPGLLATLGDGDAAAARLHPSAYRDDDASSGEFRRLMGDDLELARADDRDRFVESVGADATLGVEEAEAWLRVIGDARLVLAARRGIVDGDDEWEHLVGRDPDLTLVAWLGYLQSSLVDALSGTMP